MTTIKRPKILMVEGFVFDQMTRLCRNPDATLHHDDVVFDRDVMFPDGRWMAIQVCVCSQPEIDPCYAQGVLFSPEGHELNCTDCGDDFGGSFCVPYQGTDYIVDVRRRPGGHST